MRQTWVILWTHRHGVDVAVRDEEPEFEDGHDAVRKFWGEEAEAYEPDRDEIEVRGPFGDVLPKQETRISRERAHVKSWALRDIGLSEDTEAFKPACPKCGWDREGDIKVLCDSETTRDVIAVTKGGVLLLSGSSETLIETERNERLYCGSCSHEWDGIKEVEYL